MGSPKVKCCKIISVWFGKRTPLYNSPTKPKDQLRFLREHQIALAKSVDPGVDMDLILVLSADDHDYAQKFRKYFDEIDGQEIKRGTIKVFYRKNTPGKGFDAFAYGYDQVKEDYDYFLFCEDDVVFFLDDYYKMGVDTFSLYEECWSRRQSHTLQDDWYAEKWCLKDIAPPYAFRLTEGKIKFPGLVGYSPFADWAKRPHFGGGLVLTRKSVIDDVSESNEQTTLHLSSWKNFPWRPRNEVDFTYQFIEQDYQVAYAHKLNPYALNWQEVDGQQRHWDIKFQDSHYQYLRELPHCYYVGYPSTKYLSGIPVGLLRALEEEDTRN